MSGANNVGEDLAARRRELAAKNKELAAKVILDLEAIEELDRTRRELAPMSTSPTGTACTGRSSRSRDCRPL